MMLLQTLKQNFIRNINVINESFEIGFLKKIKYKKILVLIFIFFIYFFASLGYHLVTVHSGSDHDGVYFSSPYNKTSLKNDEFVAFCLPNKAAHEMAKKFGLTDSHLCPFGGTPLVKHICATPGDRIVYKSEQNIFSINNIPQEGMTLIKDKRLIHQIDWSKIYIVPQGSYFICGQDKMSFDSRYYGAIPQNFVKNKMTLLFNLP